MKIMESGGNQMTRLVKQEPLDRIRIATVVDSQSADNSRLSHIKQHNIRKNGLATANSNVKRIYLR